ncbi:hypothetical protein [Phaeobacter gallaeciensis]|uniref:hypothetical protein n=1 Tax=Phaeobacter gallaeciensis TaxID=60890 RepID=UPI00237F67EF|nr:hypothetical protein [Phaeobacter gallaeciensis]MDE4189639.1 hypothetical protein [Phaeobacter gallaeciensis]MDE4198791.1 hypothetical protein [Phaeobacter gallaeciensis]MDE4202937.1 hypothetical protein [Phaeobacter gallaeciensis]MDE4207080.1 hypothetical protein [Phaeobacter gallaeciensis]MDE4215695.1 hypothetical protein [Phaeobacter gallaeciensis]
MGKSEGATVREAFDGPEVTLDQLIAEITARVKEARARASDSSESSAKTTKFLDETGLNSQAYRWAMTVLKKMDMKDGQNKAMDIIRSLEVLTPLLREHVNGAGTGEMDLEGPKPKEEAKPAAKTKAAAKPKAAKPKAAAAKPKLKAVDSETAEFNAAVDKTMGDGKGNVTPIDFDRGSA